jgi:dephospho-CoA kinase
MVLGYSESGKTTAAEIIASIIGSKPPRNCSDFIMKDYAESVSSSPAEAQSLMRDISANKNSYRNDLFQYGLDRQSSDPAYPISEAVRHTNVVTGARTPENLAAARNLFDLIVWIDREGVRGNPTDQLDASHADAIIDNNGDLDELRDNINVVLVSSNM